MSLWQMAHAASVTFELTAVRGGELDLLDHERLPEHATDRGSHLPLTPEGLYQIRNSAADAVRSPVLQWAVELRAL